MPREGRQNHWDLSMTPDDKAKAAARDRQWESVYYQAEPHYTRSGRVLNPAPGGWCPTRGTSVMQRFEPYRTEEACQTVCDGLNAREGHPDACCGLCASEETRERLGIVADALTTEADDESEAA